MITVYTIYDTDKYPFLSLECCTMLYFRKGNRSTYGLEIMDLIELNVS